MKFFDTEGSSVGGHKTTHCLHGEFLENEPKILEDRNNLTFRKENNKEI